MPAGRLHPDAAAGLLVDVADRLEHHELHRQRRRAGELAGRRLDEVRAGGHREQRRAADVVVGAELGDLEDHLQVGLAAGLLDADDLVVDLARTGRRGTRRGRSPCRSRRRRAATASSTSRSLISSGLCPDGNAVATDATLTPVPARRVDGDRHEVRVDADRSDRRDGRIGRVGPDRLRAERRDLARRVLRPRASSGRSSGSRARAPRPSTRA